jgi:hypothetical protein
MANASHVNDSEGGGDDAAQNEALPTDATQQASDQPLITDSSVTVQLRSRPSNIRTVLLVAVLLLIIGSGVMLWVQRDTVLDWVHSRGYTPTRDMSELADHTTMTPYAKRLFFVNYPAIEEKDTFNKNCPDASHEVAVLGCYRGNRNGIHLYHVTDARLAGITEVTAAHEMLHQAFDRLSASDKKRVNDMLNSYYKNGLTDKNILDKMASYKKLEPNDMVNEMHSVFGTEVGNLPADLEAYYKQYFTDRSKIVTYRNQYVSAFSQRQQQIEDYDKQRDELKLRIDQAQNDLDSWEVKLKATRDAMNQWLAASEIERYNMAVPSFNAQVAGYKTKVVDTNALIDEYNTITDKRNALTAQEQELLQAQDSHASSASAE